jgi:formate hydrogenlyase subunit 6/NADH:ubiquinone oxidoreductase subunit I
MASLSGYTRSFLLTELLSGMWLTLKYFFTKKGGDDQLPLRKRPVIAALQG